MSADVACFLIEPIPEADWVLRITSADAKKGACSKTWLGVHDAVAVIDTGPLIPREQYFHGHERKMPPLDDPRWPRACECGYVFGKGDLRRLGMRPVYVSKTRAGRFSVYGADNMVPGMIYEAYWSHDPKVVRVEQFGAGAAVPASGNRSLCVDRTLSGHFRKINSKRSPYIVVLPDHSAFHLDSASGDYPGVVKGEAPRLTAWGTIKGLRWQGVLETGILKGST